MVVKCMAYEVENDVNKKRQVLHRARLVLWLAEPEGEPLRMNRISIESRLTGAELVMLLDRSVKLGMVLRKLIYGLNTAMLESREELPDLTMGKVARGALMGHPIMEQATGFPVTSSPAREAWGPCWEMSLQDEHDLPDGTLEHNPTGGREWDRLVINGGTRYSCTQAAVNNLQQELH